MENFTKNFTYEELIASSTAKRLKLDNTPTQQQKANLKKLAIEILQPIRDAWGSSIVVTSGFRAVKVNKAVGGSPTSQHCFDNQTEILTNNGWKNINTIEDSDETLTLNLETQLMEYKPIKEIIKYRYDGELICADNQHISFAVTDKHRMVCRTPSHKYKRKTNRTLTEKEKLYYDSLKTNNDIFHIELAKDIFGKRRIFKTAGISSYNNQYNVDLLRMCMAVISDGFLCKKSDNISLGFNLKKERDKNELEDILKKLNWHFTKNYSISHEKQGTPGVYHYFINGTVGKEVVQIIGMNKKIPKWFLKLDPSILRQLVITYAMFDGSIDKRNNNNGITIFSIDEENIDMLQQMCILCGMRCIKKKFIDRETCIKGKKYIMPEFYNLYITQNTDESRINEERWSKTDYHGDVWCVNNENTTLVIRRNGKVSIQGNCSGSAADLKVGGISQNKKLFELITRLIKENKIKVGQLINEYNYSWIHVSLPRKGKKNNQIFSIK